MLKNFFSTLCRFHACGTDSFRQRWDLHPLPQTITHYKTDLCLSRPQGGTSDEVVLRTCDKADRLEQRWIFEEEEWKWEAKSKSYCDKPRVKLNQDRAHKFAPNITRSNLLQRRNDTRVHIHILCHARRVLPDANARYGGWGGGTNAQIRVKLFINGSRQAPNPPKITFIQS